MWQFVSGSADRCPQLQPVLSIKSLADKLEVMTGIIKQRGLGSTEFVDFPRQQYVCMAVVYTRIVVSSEIGMLAGMYWASRCSC